MPTAAATAAAMAAPPAADGPLFIVINAGSGHDDAVLREQLIREQLSQAGRPHELLLIQRGQPVAEVARQAVERARAARGVVVAAGGDGTINAVAQQVLGSGCAFGVLPQGTFNYFGREHGIPEDASAALQVLLAGHAAPVQVGMVNERVFLVNASLGLYPQLLEEREAFKARYGRSRGVAMLAGLRSLLQAHRPLRLRVGWCAADTGEVSAEVMLRTPTLFVGNNRLQLEQIGIAEAPALARGQLVGIALKPVAGLAMLWLALRGAVGRLGDAERVTSGAFVRMSVRRGRGLGRQRIKVATDGEVGWMFPPLEFSAVPAALWLIQPASASASTPDPRATAPSPAVHA
jgi:diacylglycerol kinase family enzyme